jgi:hypothetical protein
MIARVRLECFGGSTNLGRETGPGVWGSRKHGLCLAVDQSALTFLPHHFVEVLSEIVNVPTNANSPGFRRGCLALQNCLVETLNDHGHTLTTTNAHGLHADGLAFVFEGVEEGRHDASTSHTEGVTERNTATLDVQLVPANAEVFGRRGLLFLFGPLAAVMYLLG